MIYCFLHQNKFSVKKDKQQNAGKSFIQVLNDQFTKYNRVNVKSNNVKYK
jgi:hypothetical protein